MAKKKEEKKETKPIETPDVIEDETVNVNQDMEEESIKTEDIETPDEVEKTDLYTLSKPNTMFYDGHFVITSDDRIPLPDVITGPIQARLDSGFIVKVKE